MTVPITRGSRSRSGNQSGSWMRNGRGNGSRADGSASSLNLRPSTFDIRPLFLVLLAGGCSFIGVRRAEVGPEKCTSELVAPVVDSIVVGVGLSALLATLVLRSSCDEGSHEGNGPACLGADVAVGLIGLPGALISLPYGISALYGFGQVSDCRKARMRAGKPETEPL